MALPAVSSLSPLVDPEVLGWNTIVGLSRITVKPELMLTLELDLETPLEEVEGIGAFAPEEVRLTVGTTMDAVPAESCEKV